MVLGDYAHDPLVLRSQPSDADRRSVVKKPAIFCTSTWASPAATLVCLGDVCDTADDRCGYATGDGPCTSSNGATVCRSSTCSTNGLCQPAAGCNVDADCADDKWCNETMNACLPKLDNGVALPKDTPHSTPKLDGTCTDDAAALVCASGVCDSKDDECGLGNGRRSVHGGQRRHRVPFGDVLHERRHEGHLCRLHARRAMLG